MREGYGYEWDIEQRVMGKKIQFIKVDSQSSIGRSEVFVVGHRY